MGFSILFYSLVLLRRECEWEFSQSFSQLTPGSRKAAEILESRLISNTRYSHCVTTHSWQLQSSVMTDPDVAFADKKTLMVSPASVLCCGPAVPITAWGVGAGSTPPHGEHVTDTHSLRT